VFRVVLDSTGGAGAAAEHVKDIGLSAREPLSLERNRAVAAPAAGG
jgi:hypothetical protein